MEQFIETTKETIGRSLWIVWPLLLGIAMIMAGNGLQGTLLGLRADAENFPVQTIGLVMSLYYGGFLAGGYIVPRMIDSVGHIRVFAGMASLASTTILLHGVFIDPWAWGIVRLASGLSFCGLFIVCESWLNNLAPNKLRAQILGAYVAVMNLSLFGGQYLLFIAPIDEIGLFILISVLISLALLPVTLANKPTPGYETPERISFKYLFNISPLAMICVCTSGFCTAAILGMGAIYAINAGMGPSGAANLIAIYILGCGLMPIPIGWISDHYDRRKIILLLLALCVLCSMALASGALLLPLMFIYGGLVSCTYSISIAYVNDQIPKKRMVSATSTMIIINGIGACAGPFLVGILLERYGLPLFFLTPCFFLLVALVLGIYRATTAEPINTDDQRDFVPVPARSSPEIMNIRAKD